MQIEVADYIVLNKQDLVNAEEVRMCVCVCMLVCEPCIQAYACTYMNTRTHTDHQVHSHFWSLASTTIQAYE
jgi:G3E family GTPase